MWYALYVMCGAYYVLDTIAQNDDEIGPLWFLSILFCWPFFFVLDVITGKIWEVIKR